MLSFNQTIKILKPLLFIFLLLCSTSVLGINRYFKWVDPKLNVRTRLDLDTYELFKETEVGIWSSDGKIKLEGTPFRHLPDYLENHFFVFENGNRIRITVDGTGQVYDFFPLQKKLVRADNTFHSGHNFGSNQFIRKNTLYGIGGEGFWNYSTSITFFDEKTKEWEILRPRNKGPKTIVDGYQGYNEKQDVFYSGASGINNYLEDEKSEFMDDFFSFDFKQNKWSFLGKINPNLPFKNSREILWTGEYFLHFSEGKIYLINPIKNEVHLYKDPNKAYRLGLAHHENKDFVLLFWGINGGPVIKLNISDLKKNAVYWGVFYNKDAYMLYAILVVLGLTIPILIYFKRKQKKARNNALEFTPLEKKLLLSLLALSPEGSVTTNDLNDLLGADMKSPENQRRIRFKIISDVNEKLFRKYKVKDGVERIFLPEDKRHVSYKLNPAVASHLKNL